MKALALAAAAAALALPGAAQAQQKHSTQWRTKQDDRLKMAAKDAARELATYARCVARNRYERARAMALLPYASAEQGQAANAIVRSGGDNCLKGGFDQLQMKLTGEVMAGAVAQALVLKDYPDLPALLAATPIDVEDEKARAASINAAELFGRCIVRRDPAAAHALFASLAETPEEKSAIARLRDDLPQCLAAGSTIKINAMYVRNVSAVAAYRLAQQIRPRGGGASGK